MIEELQLISGEENPIRNSIITFFSFCIFGFMPLVPIIAAKTHNLKPDGGFMGAVIAIAVLFLFLLGFSKSFVTSAKWYWSSL